MYGNLGIMEDNSCKWPASAISGASPPFPLDELPI
jgi:hypothetical protein